MNDREPTLDALRDEIDRLDDRLVDLLLERVRLVTEVGRLKGPNGSPFLRPGREAEVLRRLIARAGRSFDAAALARMWREIITTALRQQGPFSVAVSAPVGAPTCWALARGHYGAGTKMKAAAGPTQAVGAVAAGEATVAVVPFPATEEPNSWWTRLLVKGPEVPRVIARLPLAEVLAPPQGCPLGLAVACITPQPSGDDRTLIAVETDPEMSRTRLISLLDDAGLATRYISADTGGGGGKRHFMVEVDGFQGSDGPELARLAEALGESFVGAQVIGAYAAPLDLDALAASTGEPEAPSP